MNLKLQYFVTVTSITFSILFIGCSKDSMDTYHVSIDDENRTNVTIEMDTNKLKKLTTGYQSFIPVKRDENFEYFIDEDTPLEGISLYFKDVDESKKYLMNKKEETITTSREMESLKDEVMDISFDYIPKSLIKKSEVVVINENYESLQGNFVYEEKETYYLYQDKKQEKLAFVIDQTFKEIDNEISISIKTISIDYFYDTSIVYKTPNKVLLLDDEIVINHFDIPKGVYQEKQLYDLTKEDTKKVLK